ncbi:MAG TPA: FtsX-like permease family protein [Vicinamibacterales bacterium]|nr:FtsX-like permease family protein [Vicinamibacterales bacterium]
MLKWLPFLWSSLCRRKLRTVLTMLSVLASFVLVGLLGTFRDAVATYGNDYSNALVVQSRDVRLPHSHVSRLLSVPGVRFACGVLMAPVRLPSQKRGFVQGVSDPGLFEVHPGIVPGEDAVRAWRQNRMSVLVSDDVAKANEWRMGDHIMLAGVPRAAPFQRSDGRNALEIVVAGIFSANDALAIRGIFAHYEYVRDLIGPERAGLEFIAVRLAPGQDVDTLRSRIDAEFRSSAAPTKSYSYRALLRAYYGTYREFARLSLVVIAISCGTLLLIAGSVMAQAQRERQREVATFEALGLSKAKAAGLLGLEAVVLIVPPATLGFGVAAVLARRIDTGVSLASSGALPLQVLLSSLALAVLLVLAVSILPIMRSVRAPIAPRLARR